MLRSDFGVFSTSALSSYGPSIATSRLMLVHGEFALSSCGREPNGRLSSRSMTIGAGAGSVDF